jgi:VWFA-related protein
MTCPNMLCRAATQPPGRAFPKRSRRPRSDSMRSNPMRLISMGIVALWLIPVSDFAADGQLTIPQRPATSLFQGDQGKQKTEIDFDPSSGIVTLKFVVQDGQGYFIPGIHRDNFVVYEDGARQTNATVEIEHAAVSLGVLIEYGGHQRVFNKDLVMEVSRAGRQLVEVLSREDAIAVWSYGDTAKQLADFTQGGAHLDNLFLELTPPDVSETNLYDALLFALNRMKAVNRRRAIVLISTGLDTFSKASYENVLSAAGAGNTPIYAISLEQIVRSAPRFQGGANPLARVDWADVDRKLREIAKVSGGRFYSPENTIDLSAVYDDVMENLKVRYVITYRSANADTNRQHTVRVDLVNPTNGQPLQIVDANGRPVVANAIVQASYTPSH